EAITHNETVDVPATMLKVKDAKLSFVLKVQGDSMIDDGILDGDYVVIKKQMQAENGQTVVALINNEATIKRFYRRAGQVELHAANPKYKPIIVAESESDEFKIEGILMGVIRLCR
ncbi:MAG: repressor LexA, partial [Deltaproteobacteria bacterium]|nr:repressor LexA [Deltaproteobacteria bacterium]